MKNKKREKKIKKVRKADLKKIKGGATSAVCDKGTFTTR